MLQFRYGIFYGGAAVAGAFSGLLAFAISFMSGTDGRLGWSWIFVRKPFGLEASIYVEIVVDHRRVCHYCDWDTCFFWYVSSLCFVS